MWCDDVCYSTSEQLIDNCTNCFLNSQSGTCQQTKFGSSFSFLLLSFLLIFFFQWLPMVPTHWVMHDIVLIQQLLFMQEFNGLIMQTLMIIVHHSPLSVRRVCFACRALAAALSKVNATAQWKTLPLVLKVFFFFIFFILMFLSFLHSLIHSLIHVFCIL